MSVFINSLPLYKTANKLRSGEYPLHDFINEICDRIEYLDNQILSFLPEAGRRERLLAEAREMTKKYQSPASRPPLFGIPIGVKDIYNVNGFATKAGSGLPPACFEGIESEVVTKLKNAGALILGKTVTTEFAYFQPGPTKNPHNTNHTPGGSSSGSAAAVAAGLTPLSLGTQTIGSLGRPASYCGVYGFKPSTGRISTKGIFPFSPKVDHAGFFCQDIEGVELTCELLLKNWKDPGFSDNRKPVIGLASGEYFDQTSEEVTNWFRTKIDKIKKAGFKVIQTDLFKNIDCINLAHRQIAAFDFAKVHNPLFKKYKNLYGEHSKNLIMDSEEISEDTIIFNLALREEVMKSFAGITAKESIDIWLSPSATDTAPKGLLSTGSPLMNLPWTFLGVPALSIPDDKINSGLPIGLQVAGAYGEDEKLIKLCSNYLV